MPNNFGVQDPHAVAELAVTAESLGFDSVWVNHHVLNVGYVRDRLDGAPYQDALTMLTWVAARTERVRLGTSVLVLPYLHPIPLAKTLATMDQLSGGRLVLGVGVGSLEEENIALGSDYASRGRYSDESIDVMKLLWTEEEPAYDGEFFSFSGVKASPKPQQKPHIPIVIGGNRPPAIRRVARVGDGWHPMAQSPRSLAKRFDALRGEMDKVGRDVTELEVQLRIDLGLGDEISGDSRHPMQGSPEQVVADIRAYAEVGVTEMIVSLSTNDTDLISSVIERYAAEVIPALR